MRGEVGEGLLLETHSKVVRQHISQLKESRDSPESAVLVPHVRRHARFRLSSSDKHPPPAADRLISFSFLYKGSRNRHRLGSPGTRHILRDGIRRSQSRSGHSIVQFAPPEPGGLLYLPFQLSIAGWRHKGSRCWCRRRGCLPGFRIHRFPFHRGHCPLARLRVRGDSMAKISLCPEGSVGAPGSQSTAR